MGHNFIALIVLIIFYLRIILLRTNVIVLLKFNLFETRLFKLDFILQKKF